MAVRTCDLAILGGGLAGGLTALALRRMRPELDLLLVESGDNFGGNHIWSFFASDVAPEHRWLTAPLITRGWRGHSVRFPDYVRDFDENYYSIESERLDEYLRQQLDERQYVTGRKVVSAASRTATLDDGTKIEAKGVIDCRGPSDLSALDCGWQKFTGQLLTLAEPHDLTRPLIMDASVAQRDGYRFVYCLPFGPAEIFVEDTYYSDTPDLDPRVLRQRIAEYADAQGWKVTGVSREETGVLPVVTGGDLDAYWRAGGNRTAKAGTRGGFFHPMTSYSLPDAVRMAVFVGELDDLSGDALHLALRREAGRHWRAGAFYRMLGSMLFRAAEPDQRYRVLQRFYRLSPTLIGRFYSGQSNLADKFRILSGRPPVPISRALRALFQKD